MNRVPSSHHLVNRSIRQFVANELRQAAKRCFIGLAFFFAMLSGLVTADAQASFRDHGRHDH